MKKLLLTLAAVALGAGAAMAAEEVTFTFYSTDGVNAYGLPNDGSTYVTCPATIQNDGAKVVLTESAGSAFRMWTDGLRLYKSKTETLTISVDGGIVTNVALEFKGSLGGSVVVDDAASQTVNSKSLSYEIDNKEETVLAFSPSSTQALQKLTITYEAALSGNQQPSGLSFAETSVSVLQGEAFTAPALVNPNNLAVTWSSSNTEVATVAADGTVTLEGEAGVTTILAEWAGDDSFAKGSASYTLEVIASAKNINDMIANCVNKGDKIYINFPMTVVFVSGQYCYVIDSSYNATLIYQNNSYAVGDVIPAGWTATYSPYNGLPEFTMSATPTSTEKNEVFYESVYSIGKVDVNKVLVLKGVTFATETLADASANFNGTLSDESIVTFRNQFRIASVEAGTYDVTCAVALFNGSLQVYPIEYAEASDDPELPATYTAEVSKGEVSVTNNDYEINVSVKTTVDEVTVTLPVPEGWDSWYYMDYGTYSTRAAYEPAWFPESVVTSQGYVKGNTFVVSVDKAEATEYSYSVMLGKGDMVDANSMMDLNIKVQYDATVGVSAIEAEGVAEYYNLQGVKVAEPENGIFVKVVNGKATKVVK